MLTMTYQKYMNNGKCCFIPGKVIDECFKILRSISSTDVKTLRAHEILQELRDISSMAIEHFDEKIAPDLKKTRADDGNSSLTSIYDMLITTSPHRHGQNFDSFAFNLSRTSSSSSVSPIHDNVVRNKSKLSSLVTLYKKQSKVIKSQSKQIAKMMKNLKQMKRRLDDSEIKNREMTESIKQLKTNKPLPMDQSPSRAKRTATMVLKRRLDE